MARWLPLGVLPIMIALHFGFTCIRTKRYSYSYRWPSLSIVVNDPLVPLIHSKIFVIDERLAFVGSVNFTRKGLLDNFETLIRIDDPKSVVALRSFVDELTVDPPQATFPAEYWVRTYGLFREPPN